MVDAGTGLTVLGTAVGSQDLIKRILGPTCDYLGAGLATWTDRAVKNTARVFEKAAKKLGENINRPGAVPPKVLKGVLESAPFCDDELGAEYFGGVLASSRSGVERDDRGAAFLALVGRLSTYQIRSHFFFYSMTKAIFDGIGEMIQDPTGRGRLRTFIPTNAYVVAMDFAPSESVAAIITHVMFGLQREALIDDAFLYGRADDLKGLHPRADVDGIVFTPSVLGAELYLWAHGRGNMEVHRLFDESFPLTSDVKIQTTPGCCSVNFPERSIPPAKVVEGIES